jgi:hypothetical protein
LPESKDYVKAPSSDGAFAFIQVRCYNRTNGGMNMLSRLLGIDSLEDTEPVVLEEVPDAMAPTLPAEYEEHLDAHNEDFFRLDPYTNLDLDGEEEVDEDEVDNGHA